MAYGVVTEQGDLGLGFNEVSEEESSIIKENMPTDETDKESESK